MKGLLLLLPIVALAAIQVARNPATRPAPRSAQRITPAPKNAPQNNLSEQFRQQKIDDAAQRKYCLGKYGSAEFKIPSTYSDGYKWAFGTRYYIQSLNGRKEVVKVVNDERRGCSLTTLGYLDQVYYKRYGCKDGWRKPRLIKTKDYIECYLTKEGELLVVYEKDKYRRIHRMEIGKERFSLPTRENTLTFEYEPF